MIIGLNLLFLLPNKVGGTETYARGLINGLKSIDKDNQYYIFCNKDAFSTLEEAENVKIICLPVSGKNRFIRFLFELFLLPLYIIKYRINLVHSLGYSGPFFVSCPSIVTVYDLNWYFYPEDFSFFKRLSWKFVVKNSAAFSTKIITSSKASKKSLIDIFKLGSQKIDVVYGGLPKLNKANSRNSLKNFGIEDKYIFTVTSTYPHKNLITLIKAFKLVNEKDNNYQLVVAGLSGRAHEEVVKYIKENKLTKKVLLLGWVKESEISTLYKYAEIMVFPSLYEGFGFPVLEAMGYGTPVISSNAYSLKEIVQNAGILIDPNNVNKLSDKIIEVLNNQKIKNQLSRDGYKRSKVFDWNSSAKKTLKIYYKIGHNGQQSKRVLRK